MALEVTTFIMSKSSLIFTIIICLFIIYGFHSYSDYTICNVVLVYSIENCTKNMTPQPLLVGNDKADCQKQLLFRSRQHHWQTEHCISCMPSYSCEFCVMTPITTLSHISYSIIKIITFSNYYCFIPRYYYYSIITVYVFLLT